MTPSKRFPKLFAIVFPFAFLLAWAPQLFGIPFSGMFLHLQYLWQDTMFRMKPSSVREADPRLILLAIDEETGRKHGFPLPRSVYAQVLDKMKAAGVKTAVFDVMFLERREGDAELAEATSRFRDVVHLFAQDLQMTAVGSNVTTSLPIKALLKAGRYFGHPNIDFLKDNDGGLRSIQLFRPGVTDPLRPKLDAVSLEAATLQSFMGKTLEQIRDEYGPEEKVLNSRLPRQWLRHEFRDAAKKELNVETVESPYRRISMLDFLNGQLTKEQKTALKGAIVIIGSTALGYYDHYPTPFLQSAPGAEYHLNGLDNYLHQDWMAQSSRLITLILIFLAAAATFYLQRLSPAQGAGAAAAILLAWFLYALQMFKRGVVVEFVPPAAAFALSYVVLTTHRALTEGLEKKAIKGLFGQFVAPEVVEQLAQDPAKVKLGGEKRDMTVFFLDIAHFTNISEKMDPEALIQFLNRYLSGLSQVILDRRGTIDKYIGDCVMAFWNAPIPNGDHRADAILAALECQKIVLELNKKLDPSVPETPAVRIGINSGVVTVGLTGSEKKLQYTVIGDEVNLASRLEGANKFFGSLIIASEAAFNGAKDRVAGRLLGRVRVVGKETPIKIYEPIAEKSAVPPQWQKGLPLWEKGVAAFAEKRYGDAVPAFEQFMKLFPEDGPGELYLRQSREYAALPPEDWDQVFNLTAK